AFLPGKRYDIRRWNACLYPLYESPAGRGNFQHASVVERMQAGIELGISPYGLEFRRAYIVSVGGFLQIYRALDRRDSARPLVGLPVTGPGSVEDLLKTLAVLRPALDDLDAIEIGGGRIFYCPDNKRRSHTRLCACHWRQVAAHGHTVG